MQPTVLKIRPQISCPGVTLTNIMQYPLLQKRINDQKYELTGIHNLIVQLKKQTIQQLKEQFICNNNSVDLHQFMWLISNSVMVKAGSSQPKTIEQQYYQYQIQYQIVKVFQDIDIDNSNSISWQQYIEYITSSSLMQINQNTDKDSLSPSPSPQKQLQFSFKQKTIFRKNPILKILEIQRLGLLAIIEKKIQNLTFININGSIPIKNILLSGVDHNKVLSIDYSQDQRIFGVLLSNHSVVFVQDCQLPKVIVDNKFVGNQIQIMYLRKHKLWLLISLDGTVQIFTPQKSRKKSTSNPSQKKLLKFKPHTDQLISIHQLHNPLSLISSSWNGSIKIWSLTINQLLVQLNPNKEDDFLDCKAIKGVQVFNYKCISYIACWMYTTEISVWLPSSSITKPYIGKLVGHMGIVQEAKFLANFPIVVSIDNKCSIRVWDVSKMQCIQSWKMDSTTNLKIFTLRSAPYVLLYDKLIHYYKSSKQQGLIEYNNQIRSSSSVVVKKKTKDETHIKQKNEKLKIRSNSVRIQDMEQKDKQKNMNNNSLNINVNINVNINNKVSICQQMKNRIQEDSENQKKININNNINNSNISNSRSHADINNSNNNNNNSNSNNEQAKYQQFQYYGQTHQKCTNVIALIYDSYLDVVVILTPDAVSIVAVNTGHLLFKYFIYNNNQSFVAICIKENRRFFVANTQAEVLFFKTEDCSLQYKIYPFKENAERDREKAKIVHQNSSTELKSQKVVQKLKKLTSDHTVVALDFNIYNKVLMVVGESENNSVIVTFDNFSQFQPMKKKQIILDQPNICSFASAQKYNIFYIGSNKPQTITIWDYHNFIILRSVAMTLPIQHLSCQTDRFNLLTVVQSTGIRIIRVQPVQNKNNTRGVEINLFSKQMIIKNIKKVKKAYIVYRKVEMEQTVKKNKVKFEQDEASEQQQIQVRKKEFHIYIISDSTVMLYLLDQISTYFTECPQPFHCDKANITKEVKYFNVNPTPCLASSLVIEAGTITKVNISGGRKNVDIIGVIHNIVYFQSIQGVLSFYKPDEGKVWSKLSMPKCSVIQWNVFFNLANKIVARLKKAEKISKETYAFKRKQKVDQQKKEYLRICFLLNKYFSFEDINYLNDLYCAKQKVKRRQRYKKKLAEQEQKFQLKQDYMDQNEEQKKSYFEHKFVQRYFNGAQAAQKIKSLQTMYSKVFNYIKQKRSTITPQQPQPPNKSRCLSASKLLPSNKLSSNTVHLHRNQSNSVFKIKNTVSSANKIYFEHTKEIKACLNKIGILNNKIKGLKL